MKWTDVNEVANKLVISRSLRRRVETTPKSRKPRSIPIQKWADDASLTKTMRLRA